MAQTNVTGVFRLPPGFEPSPADLYGELLQAVQTARLFSDGKTFVDAVALRPADEIMRDYRRLPSGSGALAEFVHDNFVLPDTVDVPEAAQGRDLRRHIADLWPRLARQPQPARAGTSALAIDHGYLVPGGRFAELYYWDSYFSMLGLIRDGQIALAERMVVIFTELIERYGFVPNGTRSYYLSRSQPPLYAAMVALLPHPDPRTMGRRLAAMKREYAFWMAGADTLAPGDACGRVVRLHDGAVLNRYWDARPTPRDESFDEDVCTAAGAPDRSAEDVYRHLRAGAESGWDFSSRWLADEGGLATIRTCDIIPVDLNAFLYLAEDRIASLAAALYDPEADQFARRARARRRAMSRHLWSNELGCFVDADRATGRTRSVPTAAALSPLFAGLATRDQAGATARLTARLLLAPGGLRTSLVETGEQWDAPNGWAPLQWIAFEGLCRYGHHYLAREIAQRWCGTVAAEFDSSGWLHEKYDVERRTSGGGGEYVPQHGFGWTNGVTAAFLDILGAHPSRLQGSADGGRHEP